MCAACAAPQIEPLSATYVFSRREEVHRQRSVTNYCPPSAPPCQGQQIQDSTCRWGYGGHWMATHRPVNIGATVANVWYMCSEFQVLLLGRMLMVNQTGRVLLRGTTPPTHLRNRERDTKREKQQTSVARLVWRHLCTPCQCPGPHRCLWPVRFDFSAFVGRA